MNAETLARVLVVEDEVIIADTLRRYLTQGGYTVVGDAGSYEEAVAFFDGDDPPDVVLLDIRIDGDIDGVAISEYVRQHHPQVARIFVTSQFDDAYMERVKSSYPSGYLTKPIHRNTLLATVGVALNNMRLALPRRPSPSLTVRDGGGTHVIRLDELQYLRSDHVYVEYHHEGQAPVTTRETFQAALDRLPPADFIQVHRSYIVNLRHVRSHAGNTVYVGKEAIPVSRGRRAALTAALGAKLT